jgi:uncharacterized protein YigE (DUF2233 family)
MRFIASLFCALVAGSALVQDAPAKEPCRKLTEDGADYAICEFARDSAEIRLAYAAEDGTPYGGLGAFASAVAGEGRPLIMAMNAGMYHADLRPVGLYIENGTKRTELNLVCGNQNFSMCPNGVFYVKDGKPRVMETKRFRREKPKADFATQSGPMLVIDGKLHPRFQADSTSRKIRNGVGMRADGSVIFVISDDYVTFHQFAVLFRDTLRARNALFFDGTVSSLHAPLLGRSDGFWPAGPIVAVFARKG